MATIKDTAATSALNEDQYINKLYGNSGDAQKKMLEENYAMNTGELDEAKKQVQQQTQTNIQRTNVESRLMARGYGQRPVSYGGEQQAALSQWNQRQADVNALYGKQGNAEYEIEQQRMLLGQQYAAEIKRAQAANDMERAQALYDAAKAEDAQLLELKKEAATMLRKKGDKSIMESLANGEMPQRDTEGETWEEVLKNEDAVNQIYNSKIEAQNQQALTEYLAKLSELAAQRRQQQQSTDKSLTESYVDALKSARNYQEVQGAYGQGSGTAAQSALARDTELQKRLTELRGVQMGADAASGMTGVGYGTAYRDALAKNLEAGNSERNKALYDAAEQEEQKLVELQRFVGEAMAKKKDYSILGKLFGLTKDQIDRMQGTGKYGRKSGDGDEPSRRRKNPGDGDKNDGDKNDGDKNHTLTPQDLIWIRNS